MLFTPSAIRRQTGARRVPKGTVDVVRDTLHHVDCGSVVEGVRAELDLAILCAAPHTDTESPPAADSIPAATSQISLPAPSQVTRRREARTLRHVV